MESPRAVILDIEGTTSLLPFVHEVLFPYSLTHAERYLASAPDAAHHIAALRALAATDPTCSPYASPVTILTHFVKRDSKAGALKALQGATWDGEPPTMEGHGHPCLHLQQWVSGCAEEADVWIQH